ncbi:MULTISPECIES: AraC family transcriptional regulator [unclassified Saccharicrinis]|uniref:AraC family transcriptional regulator n=1 Tax=unclassified Saccharicrinis TaxID=2646859 RepID=UPI003D357128
MSILNEQIQFPVDSSIIVKRKNEPHFTYPFHYHKEYELVYVEEGYGKRFVGGNVEPFENGDMVMLAPHLPHCWESDMAFFENDPNLKVKGIVVQIPNDFFKTAVSTYPEFKAVKLLLENSTKGLKILGKTRDKVAEKLPELFELKGLKRLFFYLDILNFVQSSGEFQLLNPNSTRVQIHENSRLGKVFKLVNENFNSSINLDDLCTITGLTKTGFSLWFKRNTAKNFSVFLQEFRVSKACEILRKQENKEVKVFEISYMVGFENLSNFNRAFKKITGKTPKEYRQLFNG